MADAEYIPEGYTAEGWLAMRRAANAGNPGYPAIALRPIPRAIPLSSVFPAQYVYFIGAAEGPVKIGYSANPKVRLRQFQTVYPHKLSILAQVEGSPELEREYHARFAAHRLNGEWFSRSPEILAEIARLSPASSEQEQRS